MSSNVASMYLFQRKVLICTRIVSSEIGLVRTVHVLNSFLNARVSIVYFNQLTIFNGFLASSNMQIWTQNILSVFFHKQCKQVLKSHGVLLTISKLASSAIIKNAFPLATITACVFTTSSLSLQNFYNRLPICSIDFCSSLSTICFSKLSVDALKILVSGEAHGIFLIVLVEN